MEILIYVAWEEPEMAISIWLTAAFVWRLETQLRDNWKTLKVASLLQSKFETFTQLYKFELYQNSDSLHFFTIHNFVIYELESISKFFKIQTSNQKLQQISILNYNFLP